MSVLSGPASEPATRNQDRAIGQSATVARIPLWVDLRHVPVNKRIPFLAAVRQANAEHVILDKGDPHAERADLAVLATDGKHQLRAGSRVVGRIAHVHDRKSQERAMAGDGLVVVEATDWRVIPLENLIAARRDRPGTLFALARGPEQARLFAQTLEVGVHGIVLAPAEPAAIAQADEQLRLVHRIHEVPRSRVEEVAPPPAQPAVVTGMLRKGPTENDVAADAPAAALRSQGSASTTTKAARPTAEGSPQTVPRAENAAMPHPATHPASATIKLETATIKLETATITSIEDAGLGDRVCVDTTSLLNGNEGLLVGSTSSSFALVAAETAQSAFIASRPFRVNAGAVHLYVLGPGDETRYLTELSAGQAVMATDPQGNTRPLVIGRCKVERRPHTLVRWSTPGSSNGMAVLQTAETVCLVAPDGTRRPITALSVNDNILVHTEVAGRHAGMAADGHIEER